MHKYLWSILTAILLSAAGRAAEAARPYLVALDFTSSFDNGVLGKQAGRMFRSKTARKKLYTVDNELDWEDLAGIIKFSGKVDDPQAFMAQAKKAYGCDVLVCGSIEQVEAGGRALTLRVWAFDLKTMKILVERKFDLDTNFELSQAVDKVIKDLTGAPTRADILAADPANRQVAYGPNLVPAVGVPGGTSAGTVGELKTLFKGWDFPFNNGISASFSDDGQYILAYTLSKKIAYGTGLFCYSPYVAIKPGTYYQVSFKVKSEAPAVIQFTKCYRMEKIPGYQGIEQQKKEVFKHQLRLHEEPGQWYTVRTKPFLPRAADHKGDPVWMRVQLYAYLKPGKVWFREVEIYPCREKK